MDRIEFWADISIKRGLGFSLLAISVVLLGLSYDLVLALRTAAILMAILSTVLFWKALQAPTRNYRETELWHLLEHKHGLPEERAQSVIGGVLQQKYRKYAKLGAFCAVFLGIVSVGMRLVIQ